jgi:hypothetical protein
MNRIVIPFGLSIGQYRLARRSLPSINMLIISTPAMVIITHAPVDKNFRDIRPMTKTIGEVYHLEMIIIQGEKLF